MGVREKRKSGVYLRRNSVSVNTTKRNIIPLPILQWYFSSTDYSSFITRYQHDIALGMFSFSEFSFFLYELESSHGIEFLCTHHQTSSCLFKKKILILITHEYNAMFLFLFVCLFNFKYDLNYYDEFELYKRSRARSSVILII